VITTPRSPYGIRLRLMAPPMALRTFVPSTVAEPAWGRPVAFERREQEVLLLGERQWAIVGGSAASAVA
jgi:hypothetical protein